MAKKQRTNINCSGKKIVITGSTGGLGSAIVQQIAAAGGELILVNRSEDKSKQQISRLREQYTNLAVSYIHCDMTDISSVKAAADALAELKIDILILNAGVYHINRCTTIDGLDNIFQINFAAPYILARTLADVLGDKLQIIAVSSIAIRNLRVNIDDHQGLLIRRPIKAYGYTKMLLTYGLCMLDTAATISLAHPGITYTNIMTNYNKITNALIKPIMRLIFMSPAKACRGIVKSINTPIPTTDWYSPRVFNIWGNAVDRKLPHIDINTLLNIQQICNDTYSRFLNAAK